MNFKILKISLAFLFSACGSTVNTVYNTSKYETSYSATLTTDQHGSVYEILKENFTDFPTDTSEAINYTESNDTYIIKVYLKANKLKMTYKSGKRLDDKFNTVKSKIEEVKSSNG